MLFGWSNGGDFSRCFVHRLPFLILLFLAAARCEAISLSGQWRRAQTSV
jgi:hypothetical protein